MSAPVNSVLPRLAFLVGFALFALALLAVLPDIFLLIGFGLYCITVPFWLYPKERLFPRDELAAMAKWDAADIADDSTVPSDSGGPSSTN